MLGFCFHAGVTSGFGTLGSTLSALVSVYRTMAVVRQTQMLQWKVVMTRDLQTVITGALVTYYVDDIEMAITKIADLPSDIIERSTQSILDEVGKSTLQKFRLIVFTSTNY
jgi:regulator of protease activity HflC (stomatin/prohibitin superfamily)